MLELKTFVFGYCLLLAQVTCAQLYDSVLLLQEVIIEQSRLSDYAAQRYVLKTDSLSRALLRGGSLSDLLRSTGLGGVRGYGPGGLATASFRGTGSSHTSILWNGINLISPLAGQLDLSQLPVTFFDEASVQTGGSASLYGNGSIGGTILLNNAARFHEGLTAKTFTSVGSFGRFFQDAGVQWSGKKFITSTKVFYSQAENNFPFTNINVSPIRIDTRQHNAQRQHGLLQQNYWQINPQQLVWLKFWYQDNHYEVPNTSLSNQTGRATQHDKSYRTLLAYSWSGITIDITYQGAFVHQSLLYIDPAISLTSTNDFQMLVQNAEANIDANRAGQLTTGVHYTFERGNVDAFGDNEPVRNRIAMFAAHKKQLWKDFSIAASLREEMVNGNTTPLAPSATLAYEASKAITLFTSTARNYRLPTFNDLYWLGAGAQGNVNLQPELSWSIDLGISLASVKKKKIQYTLKAVAFSNQVNDWILWTPQTGQVWSPQNIKQVWSRGVETQGKIETILQAVSLSLRGQYTFTKATNQAIYENGNQAEEGKQLMFTPLHEGSIAFRASWKKYQLNVVQQLTGKQYTDTDNTEFFAMTARAITNLWLSKAVVGKTFSGTLNIEVNNFFNTNYQSRPGFPMPGINYKIGFTTQFNKPYKQ
jgi:iron complex outermembrane receptor protein